MTILKDILVELVSMFVADARLTLAILTVVAFAAGIEATALPPLVGGAVLLLGCLVVLVQSVRRAGR